MFSHQKGSPSSSKTKKKQAEPHDGDDEGESGTMPEVGSQFSSSCEIFSLFKALAAGKKDRQPLHAEVDSDESEDDEPISHRQSSESDNTQQEDASLRHVESARTVRQSDTLHDDDDGEEHEVDHDDRETLVEGGMDKEETLRRWQESFGSSTAELDAQGSKLAGETTRYNLLLIVLTKKLYKSEICDMGDHLRSALHHRSTPLSGVTMPRVQIPRMTTPS